MKTTSTTICRSCLAFCPLEVSLEDGVAVSAVGNPNSPIYMGFSCPKGRALPAMQSNPHRLKRSLIRKSDGTYEEIDTAAAIDDIANRLRDIVAKFGPRSVAGYIGGACPEQQAGATMMPALLKALGSPMIFTAGTIDQPGLMIANALHGSWDGGRCAPDAWDTFLLIGGNPVISKQYFGQNPGQQLKRLFKSRAKLIVIDPRRTETARRAHIHLQIIPGEDPTVLAGLIHLILLEKKEDIAFVSENAKGLHDLKNAVSKFNPDYVSERAGIDRENLIEAARILGESRSGDIGTGTGPSMATRGVLTNYLAFCLQTILGFWAREGEPVVKPNVLRPPRKRRAQPVAAVPAYGFGHRLRVRGLEESVAGMPTGGLPEEILLPGEGQVKALFMHGGAMMTWPQQELVKEALESLDLLVVPDTEFSPTARVATHVIATKTQLEIPVMSHFVEIQSHYHSGYGWDDPYAAYSPAVMLPAEDCDVVDSWQIYYRVAQKLGLVLDCEGYIPSGKQSAKLDMNNEPSTDDVYEMITEGSRIPLKEVKKYPDGHIFESAREFVAARDEDCEDRLELADVAMIEQLIGISNEDKQDWRKIDEEYEFLLIPRRMQNITNSAHQSMRSDLKKSYNPAYLNGMDLKRLQLLDGDLVSISSRHGTIHGVVEVDDDLRPGVLSMSHGFGRNPGEASDPRRHGANTNKLLRLDDDFDIYTGMPRMGAVPVSVTRFVE